MGVVTSTVSFCRSPSIYFEHMANTYIFALSAVFGFLVSVALCTQDAVDGCPHEVHFAMKLLKQMHKDVEKNYVISPKSITNVVEILHAGLAETAKSELVEFFGIKDVEYTQLDTSCEKEDRNVPSKGLSHIQNGGRRPREANSVGSKLERSGDEVLSDLLVDLTDVTSEIRKFLGRPKNQPKMGNLPRKQGGSNRKHKSLSTTIQEVDVLFASKRNKMSPVYSDLVSEEFGATARQTRFGNNVAEKAINELVAETTENMITNMLNENLFNEQTELVVVSALFFKGTWDTSFKDEGQMPFESRNLMQKRKVSMMYRTDTFHYKLIEDLNIVRVPYESGTYAMYYIRHAEPYHRERSIRLILAKENLLCLINQVGPDHTTASKIKLHIPKFEETLNLDLKAILQATGELDTFLTDPDFSRMLCKNGNNVHISNIYHATKIEVSETGTVASAATVGQVQLRSMASPDIRYNVPHVYILKNELTDEILFAGVYDLP